MGGCLLTMQWKHVISIGSRGALVGFSCEVQLNEVALVFSGYWITDLAMYIAFYKGSRILEG